MNDTRGRSHSVIYRKQMIKIDLITGFLGSGKTTFIRHYAGHFLEAGQRICILENDFGAINVDRVLLQDLSDESEYLMASQCGCAGRLILSRTQLYDETKQERVIAHINTAMEKIGCMEAQNVLIVIGEGLDREAVERYFPVQGI